MAHLHILMGRSPVQAKPLGLIPLGWLGAHHWALQVQGAWYELAADTKGEKNFLRVFYNNDWTPDIVDLGLPPPDAERTTLLAANNWINKHPSYHLTAANCQHFVLYLIEALGKKPYYEQLLKEGKAWRLQ